jgi:hypothetical protein
MCHVDLSIIIGTKSTRAIVFSSYRDSVDEITDFLRRLSPLIRPAEFKGQTGRRSGQHQPPSVDVKKKRGVGGQKEQLEVLSSFHVGDIWLIQIYYRNDFLVWQIQCACINLCRRRRTRYWTS